MRIHCAANRRKRAKGSALFDLGHRVRLCWLCKIDERLGSVRS